jgi:membrane-anchored mycosin MYCP
VRRWLVAASAWAVVTGSLVVVGPTAVQAAGGDQDDPCTGIDAPDTQPESPPDDPGAPLEALQISQAHEIVERLSGGKQPGAGVRVAVVDSGVDPSFIPVYGAYATPPEFSTGPTLAFYHGTAMAGIIAGREQAGVGQVGIAPGAQIYDARVYDVEGGGDDEHKQLSEAGVIAGLQDVARLAGTGPGDIRIVNVSLTVENGSEQLKQAIDAITAKKAIVVASTGNREAPAEDEEEEAPTYSPGEDVGDTYFPAGYAKSHGDRPANPLVVAVGTTADAAERGDDGSLSGGGPGLLSSAIDVVVPTYGAVSYAINDSTCSFPASSTSVAAAEVSGILAMLMTAFPKDTPEQLVARLETTATGQATPPDGISDKYIGRGIVQPIDALTRPLRLDRSGSLVDAPTGPREQAVPAPLPREEPDVLRGTRKNAVWWGLFGGGALVVALLLRPVLSRRRARR